VGFVFPGETDPAVQLDHLGRDVPEHIRAVPFRQRRQHREQIGRGHRGVHGGTCGRPGRGHLDREVGAAVPQRLEGPDRTAELDTGLEVADRDREAVLGGGRRFRGQHDPQQFLGPMRVRAGVDRR
jgi:hypothetical protein